MVKTKDELWEIFRTKYDIMKIKGIRFEEEGIRFNVEFNWDLKFDVKLDSSSYNSFEFNFNRVIMFYERIIKLDIYNHSWVNLEYLFLSESIIILLMSALEVYLVDTFRRISNSITIKDLDKKKLLKFLKICNIQDNFILKTIERGEFSIQLSEILPKKLYFQQKAVLKNAYSLIDIDIKSVDEILWQKIYTNEESSYMKVRHHLIHSGSKEFLKNRQYIPLISLESAIFDILDFVHAIEYLVYSKYPLDIIE